MIKKQTPHNEKVIALSKVINKNQRQQVLTSIEQMIISKKIKALNTFTILTFNCELHTGECSYEVLRSLLPKFTVMRRFSKDHRPQTLLSFVEIFMRFKLLKCYYSKDVMLLTRKGCEIAILFRLLPSLNNLKSLLDKRLELDATVSLVFDTLHSRDLGSLSFQHIKAQVPLKNFCLDNKMMQEIVLYKDSLLHAFEQCQGVLLRAFADCDRVL